MDVYVVNEATNLAQALAIPGVTDNEIAAWKLAWALDYQAQYHFGRSGWRSDVRVLYLPGGGQAKIPKGGSVLHLLDSSDQPGALGYHDEDGNEVAYGKVFVQTALSDGDPPSEVASHEALELAADPNINLCALTADGSRLYAVEVGDPTQGTAYDLGAPQGKSVGIIVANFATPAYFDANTKAEKVDFRGVLSGPFTIAPNGYMSFINTGNFSAGWTQQFGAERKTPPPRDPDDRLGRRGVAL